MNSIFQQTPNRLMFQQQPVCFWIIGTIFTSVGLLQILNLQIDTTFTCSRIKSANCQLISSKLLESQSKEIPLNTLQDAQVEETRSNGGGDSGDDTAYRVVILTSFDAPGLLSCEKSRECGETQLKAQTGEKSSHTSHPPDTFVRNLGNEVPFTSCFCSDEKEANEIVSRIKNFIGNPGITSLTVKQDGYPGQIFIGGIMFVGAGILLLMNTVVTCVFNKTLGTLIIKQQNLFGTKIIVEHRLEEINNVLVEELKDADGNITYQLNVVLLGRNHLPLSSYLIFDKDGYFKVASRIRSFLNLYN